MRGLRVRRADRPVFEVANRRCEAANASGTFADRRAGGIRLDGYSDTPCQAFAHRHSRADPDADPVSHTHPYGHAVPYSYSIAHTHRHGHAVSDPHPDVNAHSYGHAYRPRDCRRTDCQGCRRLT